MEIEHDGLGFEGIDQLDAGGGQLAGQKAKVPAATDRKVDAEGAQGPDRNSMRHSRPLRQISWGKRGALQSP